jgi:hypothetical protein
MQLRACTIAPGLTALAILWPSIADAASVTLAWDPNTEADVIGYKVYYDTDPGAPYLGTQANEGDSPIDVPLTSLEDPSAPAFTFTGLPSCTLFYFAATAYSATAESDFSVEVSATVVASPNPVTAAPSAPGALLLTWSGLPSDDQGSVSGYRIQYDTDSGEPYQAAGSPVNLTSFDPYAPSYELGGLVDGTTYYIVVASVCPDATTKVSDEVTAVPNEEGSAGADGASDEAGCGCRAAGPTHDGPAWPFVVPGLAALGLVLRAGRARARSCVAAARSA